MDSLDSKVGIFFVIANDDVLLHTCTLKEAVPKDGLLIYPHSHEQVWNSFHRAVYGVDYDYFPRGRIVYVDEHDYFILYFNQCAQRAAVELHGRYREKRCQLAYDQSYRCHLCRPPGSRVLRRIRRMGS